MSSEDFFPSLPTKTELQDKTIEFRVDTDMQSEDKTNLKNEPKTTLRKSNTSIDPVSNNGDNVAKNNDLLDNNNDSASIVEALYIPKNNKVIVTNSKYQDQLRNKGFGEIFNHEYILDNLEVLFLLQYNKLILYKKDKKIDFSQFLKIFIRKDKKILTRYLIFRDLRSKGYVIKNGFGFGVDFRVYERGEHSKKPSKYVTIGVNEGTNIKAGHFASIVEQVEKMGKEPVISVIERRGEVIYYKTSKMSFLENNKQ